MKIISCTSAVYNSGAGTLTLSGVTVTDTALGIPAQQVTVENLPAANPNWSRAIRATPAAIQLIRFGLVGAALDPAALATMLLTQEPTLTWPLVIATQPVAASCVHSSTSAVFTVTITANELATTYQWQESADGSTGWASVSGGIFSGGTTATLTITPTDTSKTNHYYRCVCTNGAGNVTSNAAKLTVT